jgi:hypothetical protein
LNHICNCKYITNYLKKLKETRKINFFGSMGV